MIVLGGGLSKEQKFISKKTGFLFPAQVVSKLFKGKFLEGLKLLYDQGQFFFSFSDVMLQYKS